MNFNDSHDFLEYHYEKYFQQWKYDNWITIMSKDSMEIFRLFTDYIFDRYE